MPAASRFSNCRPVGMRSYSHTCMTTPSSIQARRGQPWPAVSRIQSDDEIVAMSNRGLICAYELLEFRGILGVLVDTDETRIGEPEATQRLSFGTAFLQRGTFRVEQLYEIASRNPGRHRLP